MSLLDLQEVHLGEPVANTEVRVLGEEAEVGQGVDFGPFELVFVELGLREDMVDLQATHLAQKARLERESRAPVAGSSHPGQQVEDGVEASAQAPAREVPGFVSQ